MAHTGKDIACVNRPVLLAVETATMCGSIALVADGECIGEYSLQSNLTHSRRLLAGIDWLMTEAGLDWDSIDGLAVSLGPGSFTGLRIGLSTVKGLAMAAGKPLLGVGTLDGLAAQISWPGDLICPVLDARKKEIYTALYRWDEAAGYCRRLGEYMAVKPAALCGMIQEPVVLVGDGVRIYGDFFRENLAGRVTILPAGIYYPRAAAIGMLAVDKWHEQDFLDPAEVVPIYVRQSEAEILFGK